MGRYAIFSDRGITKKELADYLECSQTTISNLIKTLRRFILEEQDGKTKLFRLDLDQISVSDGMD